jgi:hypothetical protein
MKEQHANESPEGRSSVTPLDLSSFRLEQGVLEIRYPLALALWDKSGALWRSVQGKWPELRLTHAEPMKTAFQIGKNALKVEVELASVTMLNPDRSLEEFSAMAKEFFVMTTHEQFYPFRMAHRRRSRGLPKGRKPHHLGMGQDRPHSRASAVRDAAGHVALPL